VPGLARGRLRLRCVLIKSPRSRRHCFRASSVATDTLSKQPVRPLSWCNQVRARPGRVQLGTMPDSAALTLAERSPRAPPPTSRMLWVLPGASGAARTNCEPLTKRRQRRQRIARGGPPSRGMGPSDGRRCSRPPPVRGAGGGGGPFSARAALFRSAASRHSSGAALGRVAAAAAATAGQVCATLQSWRPRSCRSAR
jgi:hypothetical protein